MRQVLWWGGVVGHAVREGIEGGKYEETVRMRRRKEKIGMNWIEKLPKAIVNVT